MAATATIMATRTAGTATVTVTEAIKGTVTETDTITNAHGTRSGYQHKGSSYFVRNTTCAKTVLPVPLSLVTSSGHLQQLLFRHLGRSRGVELRFGWQFGGFGVFDEATRRARAARGQDTLAYSPMWIAAGPAEYPFCC